MNYPHQRIYDLVQIDRKHKTNGELFASLLEELGELARELKIEEKVFGNFHKAPGEGTKGEAVDVFICANIQMYKDEFEEWSDWKWPTEVKDDVFDLLEELYEELQFGWNAAQLAIYIFIQRGGTPEEFLIILKNKLDKWEKTQKGN